MVIIIILVIQNQAASQVTAFKIQLKQINNRPKLFNFMNYNICDKD